MYNGVRERTESSENSNGTTTVRTISEVFRNGILVIKNAEERTIPSNTGDHFSSNANVPLTITQSPQTNTTPAIQRAEQLTTSSLTSTVNGVTTTTVSTDQATTPPIVRGGWIVGWFTWKILILIVLIIIAVVWYLKMNGKEHIQRMIAKHRPAT